MCGAGSCIAVDAATAKKATAPSAAALKAQAGKKARAEAALLANMAPADEYFGPLKLSIIGISNTIRDIGLRYKYNHDLATQSLASAQLSESAIRDWMHRYPHDPQLPRNVFFLQRLYSQILLQPSRDRAAAIAKLMFADFGTSSQAKQLKKTLAVEHLAPLEATPAPDATVVPAVEPSAQPTPTPALVPQTPEPAVTQAPYGVPTPVPTGSLAPAPAPTAAGSLSPFAATPLPAPSDAPPVSAAPSLAPVPSPVATGLQTPYAPSTSLSTPAPVVSATPAPASSSAPVPASTPGASPAPSSSSSPSPSATPR